VTPPIHSADDDVILSKLRRSLPGNTPPTGIRGNWFTGAECVRILQMIQGEKPPVRNPLNVPKRP
jgi:hypothetical protein